MALNYAVQLPIDRGGTPMQESQPPFLAVQTQATDNATVSSVVNLSDKTTVLEIAAVGTSAVIKWIPTSDTQASIISAAGTANYDHVIPSGTFRRFVVPQERAGVPSISGANIMHGLYRRVAWKSTGVGSILSSEY